MHHHPESDCSWANLPGKFPDPLLYLTLELENSERTFFAQVQVTKVRKEAAQQTLDEQEWSGSLKARQERKKPLSFSLSGSLSQKHTYLRARQKSIQPEMLVYLGGGTVAGRAGATD